MQELGFESLENQEKGFNDGCGPSAIPYPPPVSYRGEIQTKPELSDGNHMVSGYLHLASGAPVPIELQEVRLE